MINFSQIFRRVEGSDEFRNFKKENEDSFLCSAFFVVDLESQSETKQLDYYIPSKEKIASFFVDKIIKFSIDEIFQKENRALKEISPEFKIGFGEAVDIAKKRLEIENSNGVKRNSKINKVIAILQKLEKNQIWNLTCMTGGTSMMIVHIDAYNGDILKTDKVNIMNFVRRV